MPTSVTSSSGRQSATEHLCYHCNEPCPDERLRQDDKYFCCEGCKLVYEILDEHGLCDFYALDKNAGVSLKQSKSAKAYAFLDDDEIQEKLLEFNSADKSQVTFYLPQMHCVSCIWLLENLYKLDKGVNHSRVNFLKKTATIQFDPGQTSLRKIASLLNSIGYAPEINLGDVDKTSAPKISRKLAYQLAVSGFAFGNIMLFSFPEYVGMEKATYQWFSDIFGYLSILLAIPVLLFSAKDYFISAWQGLKTRQLNIDVPLCLALTSLFGRSVWEIVTGTGGGYLDSFAGLTFLLLIGRWFQQKTWHQLSFERDYKSYFPVAASLKSEDGEKSVPIQRLVPGDIILVRSQEIIPADGILLKGSAQIDYSFVTGEADPVQVNSGDRIFAGGKQLGESIEISLTRRVSQSSLTRLWNDNANKKAEKGDTTKLADQAGRIFSWLILSVGGGAFLYWNFIQHDIITGINAFTAVMIVACPCTVALSIPFTLGNIQRLLGRHRFYLKNIGVVEAFSSIKSVVFDKTGTITNIAQQSFQYHGKAPNYAARVAIRSLTKHSSHPLSRWIYESMPQIPVEKPESFKEMPGLGLSGRVNGMTVKIGSSAFVSQADNLVTDNDPIRGKSGVFIEIDGETIGHYEVQSRYRDGLEDVLNYFKGQDFLQNKSSKQLVDNQQQIWLLSGDQDREADRLTPFFPAESMRFNTSPQGKLDFIKDLQDQHQKVMMIGDGLNDAGALQQSDLGIVIAENTNNFTPACDAILHAEEFSQMPKFIQLARSGVTIVHWSYLVAVLYNIFGLSVAVSGHLSPLTAAILMPLSSVSIVLFGVGLGNWRARRLGLLR
ncbi:MAG: heavy metal translocating P-type ATPase metal-binding domain-containing protein [Lewinellaceae bacterium]|nr:heavy metal translocating P-type ATPase metal-binding domain-containing protein [Saprospiraceae bacterium]MCB9345759.1 heavy metal translocating P-type ATPase metal-binding domain-containing protein [Lewinellaceae bacterium]